MKQCDAKLVPRRPLGLVLAVVCLAVTGHAAETNAIPANPSDLTLDQLINIQVTSVSKKETSVEDSPAAISVVTADDIDRLGITSIPDALRLIPGMDVAEINANQWAVSVRGFNAQYTDKLLVLIDGRSVYTPGSGGVFWNAQTVMMQDVDRIEVIRGPGAALWGANAVDGVINVVSKSARETQGLLIDGEGGNQVQPLAAVRYGGELASNVYYRAYVQRSDYSSFLNTTGQNAQDQWNSTLGGFRLDYEPLTQNFLTLQGDYYVMDAGAPFEQTTLVPPAHSFPAELGHDSGGNLLGRWTHDFSPSTQFTLQTYFDHDQEANGFGGEEIRNTYDVDSEFRFALGSRNDIVCGSGYRYYSDDNTGTFTVLSDPQIRGLEIFNLFAQDEISIVPNYFSLTLGSKLQFDNIGGWQPQPDARLLWTPDRQQTVWASVSRATTTPALVDQDSRINADAFQSSPASLPVLVSILGNPNIGVETLTAYELGYRVEPIKNLSFDLTGFYNFYDSLIVVVPNPTRVETTLGPPHVLVSSTWQNAGAAQSHGAELSAQWRVTDSWRLMASYSWLDLEMSQYSSQIGKAPPQQFQVRSYLDLPYHLQLNGAVYFVDRSDSPTETGVEEIPAYARVDLGLVWHPLHWLEMGVWGENLLQSQHLEFSSQNTPALTEIPRSVLAKITMRL